MARSFIIFFCYLPTTALDLFFSRGGSLFYYFVLVGSFNFVLLGSFNFVLLGSYTCKYKYNNNRRCLQLPAVRRYCLTRPGASPEGDWESAGNWLGLKLSSSSGYMSTAQILHFHQEKSLLETGTVAEVR